MASRHRRPAAKPIALGAAGAGLVGALALTGPAPAALFNAVAHTMIVVGGNSDPTGQAEWDRIRGYYTGTADPVLITYPADVGVGLPNMPPLSLAGRDTYAGSVDEGSDSTAAAINDGRANGGDVTVYALSLGADVVGVALVKAGPRKETDGDLTVVAAGSPSFVDSGIWNLAPPFIPGLRNGPVQQGPADSGAEVTSICIKGDSICGLGTDPITASFYFLPGFDLHGKDYTAAKIGRYSPTDGSIAYTPGAVGDAPDPNVPVRTETRNGHEVTVVTYADGTVKRTWVEDGTTWVVLDTGENPWGRLFRENGLEVPRSFDTFLNKLMPVPEPGERGPLSRPDSLVGAIAAVPTVTTGATIPSIPQAARHALGTPGTVPVTSLLGQGGSGQEGAERISPRTGGPVAPAPVTRNPADDDPLPPPSGQQNLPVGTQEEGAEERVLNLGLDPVDPEEPPVDPVPSDTGAAPTTPAELVEPAAAEDVSDAA